MLFLYQKLKSIMLRQASRCDLVASKLLSKRCTKVFQRRSAFSKTLSQLQSASATKPPPMTLYNSLTESYNEVPLSITTDSEDDEGSKKGLAWYTCGPTVYDSAHLGHARTYVSLDIIQRALIFSHKMHVQSSSAESPPPPPPIFIMNITDVDDKILQRAKERNVSPLDLAKKYEKEFWEDMDSLNVMRPTVVTRVTEHVESSIIPYISKIEENGLAYYIPDDGVYFDVRAFEAAKGCINRYGKLASSAGESTFFAWQNNESDTIAADEASQKKDPRDFVLWKCREDKSEDLCWDSPWGNGRPGWHIECSAMIDFTMQSFDQYRMYIHAGGIDLKFPHHTNEIAQAEAYRAEKSNMENDGTEWIPHWVHTGHLHINGLKMSKSLKNFITIRDILKTTQREEVDVHSSSLDSPGDDFRLWCLGLSGSYRSPTTYSQSRLLEAAVTREKILRFLVDGEQWLRRSTLHSDRPNNAKWSESDHNLVRLVGESQAKCHNAILGMCKEQSRHRSKFDFDGSSYLASVIDLSEAGSRYIRDVSTNECPVYPIECALNTLRECLSIAGFSDRTIRAGLTEQENELGDKETLVEEFVSFRQTIREAALLHLKGAKSENDSRKELSKYILEVCDEVRDTNLATLGIEVFDGDASPAWRFGVAHNKHTLEVNQDGGKEKRKKSMSSEPERQVNSSNFFRVGRYDGMFSQFDSDGIPTVNINGSEVSKRTRKKLVKKMAKYVSKYTQKDN